MAAGHDTQNSDSFVISAFTAPTADLNARTDNHATVNGHDQDDEQNSC